MADSITIAREDPRQPDVVKLVRDLDAMFHDLYPAESNHLVDIETLAKPDIHFFVVRQEGKAIGTGALVASRSPVWRDQAHLCDAGSARIEAWQGHPCGA